MTSRFSAIGFSSLRALAVVCALVIATASPSRAAAITFAQYLQVNGAEQQWSITTVGNQTTVSASGLVSFGFSGVTGLPFAGLETALFTLNATTNQPADCGACDASFVQQGYSGTFSFIDIDSDPGGNLLSGVFNVTGSPSTSGAQFFSSVGSSGAGFDASSTPGNLNQLVFTSSYLNFLNQDTENASWSLSSLVPNFFTTAPVAGQAYPGADFLAAGTGTFSSSPGPASATPEPGTLVLIGAALIVLAVAGRKRFAR